MSRPTRKIAGAEVSAMGVGAMSFAEFYGPTTEENSWAVLDAAMELGVTHIDTSNVYGMGRSEEAIGAYLRRNGAAREVFHIATKAGISKDAAGNRCFDNSPEHLEAELDRSLSRMGIEAVDLFYVHRREEARPIEEVTATLVALRDKGKIKGFGFSEIAPASLRRAVITSNWSCNWVRRRSNRASSRSTSGEVCRLAVSDSRCSCSKSRCVVRLSNVASSSACSRAMVAARAVPSS